VALTFPRPLRAARGGPKEKKKKSVSIQPKIHVEKLVLSNTSISSGVEYVTAGYRI
jgi:hypothetical protein